LPTKKDEAGPSEKRVRIAAVADLHCTRTSQGSFQPLFSQIGAEADVLLLCGDLTDHGLPEEGQVLLKELSGTMRVPIVAVFGNHDLHSGKSEELERMLTDAGIHLLDGDNVTLLGVGFGGVKGFGGGFGRHTLEAWGEESVKRFVYEAVEEGLKLEKALSRLTTPQKVAVLHYAPIADTIAGEPEAIFPFLGSSRLEEPLNTYQVTAVFHGHAHHGKMEGKTRAGIPVYNCSLPVLRSAGQPLFRVLELSVPEELAVRDETASTPETPSRRSASPTPEARSR
jgi:Icc-related predicted phosphoesterase